MQTFNLLPVGIQWFFGRFRWVFLLVVLANINACATTDEAPDHGDELSNGGALHFYLSRLPDRDFIEYYGGDEHPRIWYRAAEELGRMGKAAIPPLIQRLDSPDPYEVMLTLYALMLASQDFEVVAETGGEYIQLGTVLTESTNDSNRRIALRWWNTYSYLWD